MEPVALLVAGAILGFGASYLQWRLTLARADMDRKREKLELLHEQLNRWADMVRYTIHKRLHPGLYYPDPGRDPSPQIRTLMRLYAPEFRVNLATLLEAYGATVEKQLLPSVAVFDPILKGVSELQNHIRSKLEEMDS